MSQSMIQAAVTMNQLQNKLDVIGHNMANSQTNGYKARHSEFSSLLFQQMNNLTDPANQQGRLTPDGVRVGSGARLGSINNDFSAGAIQETGRALDAALRDENLFYQVQVTENGVEQTRYTRDGAFYFNPVNDNESVMLTTSEGHPVVGEDGPIIIPAGFDQISIQENGQIVVQRGESAAVEGTIDVVEVIRPRLLETTGNNLFQFPDLEELGFALEELVQAPGPGTSFIQSGALEQSNVDISKQLTGLIEAQRSYQMNARTLTMGDQMMGLVNQLRS